MQDRIKNAWPSDVPIVYNKNRLSDQLYLSAFSTFLTNDYVKNEVFLESSQLDSTYQTNIYVSNCLSYPHAH